MKKLIRQLINILGYDLVKVSQPNKKVSQPNQAEIKGLKKAFYYLLDSAIRVHSSEKLFFVQVGANDGKQSDPIYSFVEQYNLKGIVIEPQPNAFKELAKNYLENPNIICENVAVGNQAEKLMMYVPTQEAETKASIRLDTRSSFKFEVIKETLANYFKVTLDEAEKYIQSLEVDVVPFNKIAEKYNIKTIDLLQIDVEGQDFMVLCQVFNSGFRPSFINLEIRHLDGNSRQQCEEMLLHNNYCIFPHGYGFDLCAIRLDIN